MNSIFSQLEDYCSVPGSPIDEHPTDNTRVSFEWRVVLLVQRSLYTRVFWWLPPGLLTTVGRDEARGCRAFSEEAGERSLGLVFDDAFEHGGQMGLHDFVFFWGLIA